MIDQQIQAFGFDYRAGYNNGVYIINDVCKKLYSNATLGIYARNLTIEDLEATFGDKLITKRNEYSYDEVGYGLTRTYPGNAYYPTIYAEENGSGVNVTEDNIETGMKSNGINKSDPYYSKPVYYEDPRLNDTDEIVKDALTCTQTFYSFSEENWKTLCLNETTFNMIANQSIGYFLASRCVWTGEWGGAFAFHVVNNHHLDRYTLTTTQMLHFTDRPTMSLRPAITISRNYVINKCEFEADGSDENHMHTLDRVSK